MWNGGYGMGGAGGVIGLVIMLVVLALFVVGVVLLIRGLSGRHYGQSGWSQGPPPSGPAPKSAVQILEERFARGEIDREEFLQRKQDLLGG